MKLFLAPHHDDETLFGAYTLLRERPLVLVCFPGGARFGSVEVRQAETAAAMTILGCEWQAGYDAPFVPGSHDPIHVWAPLPETGGHPEHNEMGEAAAKLWPGRVTFYATYTMDRGKTTVGERVDIEPGWEDLKRQALACYQSQIANPGTRPHFERALDEYVVEPSMVTA